MKIKLITVVERTKGGAVHIKPVDNKDEANQYIAMCDSARGCHCKSRKECNPHIIHSIFEIVVLRGETIKKRYNNQHNKKD